jgi:hypothetical protein
MNPNLRTIINYVGGDRHNLTGNTELVFHPELEKISNEVWRNIDYATEDRYELQRKYISGQLEQLFLTTNPNDWNTWVLSLRLRWIMHRDAIHSSISYEDILNRIKYRASKGKHTCRLSNHCSNYKEIADKLFAEHFDIDQKDNKDYTIISW